MYDLILDVHKEMHITNSILTKDLYSQKRCMDILFGNINVYNEVTSLMSDFISTWAVFFLEGIKNRPASMGNLSAMGPQTRRRDHHGRSR